MRYITPYDNLILYRQDGTIGYNPINKTPYKFGSQGVLVVGLATTDTEDANKIVASNQSDDNATLCRLFKTDLLGGTSVCVEMCGQGSLTKTNDSDSALTNLIDGYRGLFFKAPVLTTTTSALAGQRYRVLAGSVTYNNTSYKTGQEFNITEAGDISPAAGAQFALAIPDELKNKCEAFLTEEFKIKHLQVGDEPKDYFKWNEYGFDPKASQTPTDDDYYGWTR